MTLVRKNTAPSSTKKYRAPISRDEMGWQMADGASTKLGDMDTKHLFNSMKMLFNHLVAAHGGVPVWFTHYYEDHGVGAIAAPQSYAKYIVAMIEIILERQDLPPKYSVPFAEIMKQICPQKFASALPMPAIDGDELGIDL